MAANRLADIRFGLVKGSSSCDASRKIRNVGGPVCLGTLEDHGVLGAHFVSPRPTARRIDLIVPTGTSSPIWPGIVTTFRLLGCLKCRWLPVLRTCFQPSDSSRPLERPLAGQIEA